MAKPQPTRCGATVITKAGDPFEVIGPGDQVRDIPSPGDYVRDNCDGAVYFRDQVTQRELPSTQVGGELKDPHGAPSTVVNP